MTPEEIERENERRRREALGRTAGGSVAASPHYPSVYNRTGSSSYPTSQAGRVTSPHYPNVSTATADAQRGQQYIEYIKALQEAGKPQVPGKTYQVPSRMAGESQYAFEQRMKAFADQSQKRSAATGFSLSSGGGGSGGGGGGGAVGGGRAVDPNAGTTLPSLPPELERWYQEQLSQARTEEEQAMAQARLARRSALLQAAEQARAARRAATTGAMDVGAAMAGVGLGTSPAILGAALDQVYGAGGAGVMAADAARTSALENFLREETGITGQGRRRRSDLEDWRALQIAALSNEDLAKLISGSPLGGR